MSGSLEQKIQRMEAILLHSLSGIHALFPNQKIKKALQQRPAREPEPNQQELKQRREQLIRQLVECNTLQEKLHFLETLDHESYSLLVEVYLEIIEGALKSSHSHQNIH